MISGVRDPIETWLAIAMFMTVFGGLIGMLMLYAAARRPHPELLRKLLHAGSGLATLPFPIVFADVWPTVVLTGFAATVLASAKLLPPVRHRLGSVLDGTGRSTCGELYFPIAVAAVFWITQARGEPPLLFVIPILVLSIADAVGGLVGLRYGRTLWMKDRKSVEGSAAFLVTAILCIYAPLLASGRGGACEALVTSVGVGVIAMLLEAGATGGLDNLSVPIGTYLGLRLVIT